MPLTASRCFIGIGGGGRVRTSDTRPRCRRPWLSMLGQSASKELQDKQQHVEDTVGNGGSQRGEGSVECLL